MQENNQPNGPHEQLLEPTQTPTPTDQPAGNDDGSLTGEGSSKKHAAWRDFGSFVGILLVAGLMAFVLISFVFRSYAVDGPSMQTTLQNQDKLIIWKIPRTIARITGHQYIPNRGDVIIFSEDNLSACGQSGSRQLIKRVIGLPGEHVVVKDGKYTVYNTAQPGGFDPDATLPYNKDGHIPVTDGDINVTLGSDQLFVSGDNRPDSCDSRAFGPIQSDQVIGKLVLRLLPANNIKVF